MPRFQNFNDAAGNADFNSFVRNEFNKDISELADFEKEAVLVKYKYRINDFDDNVDVSSSFGRLMELEQDGLSSAEKRQTLDKLAGMNFSGKTYAELSGEDQAFIASEYGSFQEMGINIDEYTSLADIRSFLAANATNKQQNGTEPENVGGAEDLGAEEQNETPEVVLAEETEIIDDEEPEVILADNGRQSENTDVYDTVEVPLMDENENMDMMPPEYRMRSLNGDENEALLDLIKIDALQNMGVIDIGNSGDLQPSAVVRILNETLPKLTDEQLREMESRMTDKMLEDEELFNLMPPAMLAKKYNELYDTVARQNEADAATSAKMEKIAGRMDELTEMLVKEHKTPDDLHFADTTNIADAYDGYMAMFDAYEKHLKLTGGDAQKADNITAGRGLLGAEYVEYRLNWNLDGLSPNNAGKLEKRFDELNKRLGQIEIDAATAELVGNFKFLDENGQPKPQFEDKKGHKSDTYAPGNRVIKGSGLHTAIRLAKQEVLLENLGTDEQLSDARLQREVSDKLTETLYTLHVASEVEKGALENPQQFTDKQYLDDFTRKLEDKEHPMSVTPTAFEAGVDNMVNATAGYAQCLAREVGNDKPVVSRVFEPIKDIDKRAEDRQMKQAPSKRKIRIEMLKRAVKGAISTFAISAGISGLGAMAAADATLTTATFGLNRLAGLAIGTTLAVALTATQVRRWRKQQKKEGKPAGLKALLKNRKMVMTIGTTALGAAALGFVATGNPSVASALGVGAIALGTTNGVISNYQDSRQGGLGKAESAGWAAVQALSNIAGAMAGRMSVEMVANAWKQSHPDSELFNEKKTIERMEVERHMETTYKEGVVERAQETIGKWYRGNEDLLQQRVEAINVYNAEHGTNIDPYRYLLAAHDAGALAPDNMALHVQGGPDVHSGGNHMVLGEGWSNETGISQEMVSKLAQSVQNDRMEISPESVQAFNQIDDHINMYNQVGHVDGAPIQNDGVLSYNAAEQNGRNVSDLGGDRYTTYADHSGVKETTISETTRVVQEEITVERPDIMSATPKFGMFGVLGEFINKFKPKKRAGSLLDKTGNEASEQFKIEAQSVDGKTKINQMRQKIAEKSQKKESNKTERSPVLTDRQMSAVLRSNDMER